ncbi:hypothetical protein X797_004206 [Metarhizium robertsii]|uniref:Uncharacterized protein n=1 Tax=Metarhizium robertsii TaxID=568076 RepID=A0A0A1V0I2_9HYPO|nr:hypothetical protein X797_004206 [Metarhizium robertsii]
MTCRLSLLDAIPRLNRPIRVLPQASLRAGGRSHLDPGIGARELSRAEQNRARSICEMAPWPMKRVQVCAMATRPNPHNIHQATLIAQTRTSRLSTTGQRRTSRRQGRQHRRHNTGTAIGQEAALEHHMPESTKFSSPNAMPWRIARRDHSFC